MYLAKCSVNYIIISDWVILPTLATNYLKSKKLYQTKSSKRKHNGVLSSLINKNQRGIEEIALNLDEKKQGKQEKEKNTSNIEIRTMGAEMHSHIKRRFAT